MRCEGGVKAGSSVAEVQMRWAGGRDMRWLGVSEACYQAE